MMAVSSTPCAVSAAEEVKTLPATDKVAAVVSYVLIATVSATAAPVRTLKVAAALKSAVPFHLAAVLRLVICVKYD